MTNHVARLYSLVAAVLVFFVAWAAIAAHPWQAKSATAQDPRVAALQAREQRVRAESLAVKRVVDRRWAVYRARFALRKQEIATIKAQNTKARAAASLASAPATAAAPSVRVVTLPPLTITRTS
jgi:hypothetical protein